MAPDGEVAEDDLLVEYLNWEELRRLSLEPGGFRERRVHIWPQLLRIDPIHDPELPPAKNTTNLPDGSINPEDATNPLPVETHRDERQIQLDTERSFVLYPVDDLTNRREILQNQLHELLLAVFRKHPKLSYFQGYHDIITVIFMTLPPETQLICAEKLSLQRLRDSMGSTLGPVLGLLRVLKNILRLADPSFSSLLERSSPLPYYALSNLLTLFSHDMPTLSLIQHVFDYLLCRPPIVVVYLAAALILSRRQEVERLEREGEDGMVHSLLSGLPDISDGVPITALQDKGSTEHCLVNQSEPKPNSQLNGLLEKDTYEPLDDEDLKKEAGFTKLPILEPDANGNDGGSEKPSPDEYPNPDVSVDTTSHAGLELVDSKSDDSDEEPDPPPTTLLPPKQPRRPNLTLTSLLSRADELYSLYPPTHPSVALSSIMGPQSVMFTWSENLSEMPEDDEAELMVQKMELIVRPHVDSDTESDEGTVTSKRRKPRDTRKPPGVAIRRRTVVAGAVLVLGVGIALYGIRAKSLGSFSSFGDLYGKEHIWNHVGAWVGGALAAGSEHLINVR